ncbi:hypothetical protein TNCV_3943821 [Trichonephila clavipes]|nr:hypothetical protein TNCV_3943821 [Trichonephila clavipes]
MVSVQHLLDQCRQRTTNRLWKPGSVAGSSHSFGSDLGPRGRVEILSSGSFSLSPSLGSVSTSHDGCVQCGFDRLPSSRRRVREMVDVVGRLGNASRRSCALAHRGSSTLEAGFGKHVQRSHEKALAHGMPSDVTLLDHI